MLKSGVRRLVRRRRTRSVRRRRTWPVAVQKHYALHKEAARKLCHARLEHFNQHYGFSYNRVSIKNTRGRWGSCSSNNNLNFNYRILFLPPEVQDYLIVHELCHLKEMNHGPQYWLLVAEQVPKYKDCIKRLRAMEQELFVLK